MIRIMDSEPLKQSFEEVPIFKPSEQEFAEGPFKYVEHICSKYPDLALCLIEPPSSFHPEEVLDQDSLTFTTHKINFLNKKSVPNDRTLSFRQFCDVGDDFKRDFFKRPPDVIPVDEIEKIFWSLMLKEEDIEVQNAHRLSLDKYRPKFLMRKSFSRELMEKSWSFSDIASSGENMLSYIKCDGKQKFDATLDIGMCFTHSKWKREFHWCLNLNFLHYGDSRIWYAISPDSFPNFCQSTDCSEFEAIPSSSHCELFPKPFDDLDENIKIYRAEQQAGQFLLIMPRILHSFVDVGVNLIESIPIGPASWLKIDRQVIEHLSDQRLPPFFSHEELISRVACEAEDLEIEIAKKVLDEFSTLVQLYEKMRANLEETYTLSKRKQAFELIPVDDRRCKICKTIVFISAFACKCPGRYVCIKHAEAICKDCDTSTLSFRYDDDDFNSLTNSLKERAEGFENWLSEVDQILYSSKNKIPEHRLIELLLIASERGYPDDHPSHVDLKKLDEDTKQLVEIVKDLMDQQKKFDEENERRARAESTNVLCSLTSARIKRKMETEKENPCTSPSKAMRSASLKLLEIENDVANQKLLLSELHSLFEILESHQVIVPHMDWLTDSLKRCNEVVDSVEKIKTLDSDRMQPLTSGYLEKLIDDARGIAFINFSDELKSIKSKLEEIKWVEECENLLNENESFDNPKPYDLSVLKSMIDSGLSLKSNSRDIVNCLNRLHKIHGDASKWMNNTKVLLNIIKTGDNSREEGASKPTIGELSALAEEVKENSGLRRVDLSPYWSQLEELLTNCRSWMNKVSVIMNTLRCDGRPEEDIPFVGALEELYNEGKGLGCQLKDLSRIKNTLDMTNNWRDQLYRIFVRKNPLYNLLSILTPLTNGLLPASIDLVNTSSRCYYQQLRKQSISCNSREINRKSSRFEKLLNGDYSFQKILEIYRIAEEEEEKEINVLREKHMVKNSEIVSAQESPGNDEAEKTAKEQEKNLKKFCFCGKPVNEWMAQCQTCQEWFHFLCVQSYLPNTHPVIKSRNKAIIPVNPEEIRDQFNFICPLCCRGNRPSIEKIRNLLLSYQRLPVKVLEGELLLCLHDRIERFKGKFRSEVNSRLDLLKGYGIAEADSPLEEMSTDNSQGSPCKNKRKSPLVLRGELSESPNFPLSQDSRTALWNLILEGNLIEATIPELQNLWNLWILVNPSTRTVIRIEANSESLARLAPSNIVPSPKKVIDNNEFGDKDDSPKGRLKRKKRDRGASERGGKRRGRRTRADKEEGADEAVCFLDKNCKKPEGEVHWIYCDGQCQAWLHMVCAEVSCQEAQNLDLFFCKKCREPSESKPVIQNDHQKPEVPSGNNEQESPQDDQIETKDSEKSETIEPKAEPKHEVQDESIEMNQVTEDLPSVEAKSTCDPAIEVEEEQNCNSNQSEELVEESNNPNWESKIELETEELVDVSSEPFPADSLSPMKEMIEECEEISQSSFDDLYEGFEGQSSQDNTNPPNAVDTLHGNEVSQESMISQLDQSQGSRSNEAPETQPQVDE
ncbi:lysine-specific demethylase 5A-like [Brevipalpus obovatus]|uniref:lysine-specific demethylase 5A-like n=1 Tax=Brevipalpus obovatus TaxID=246614 RepID=UPI003D9E0EC7